MRALVVVVCTVAWAGVAQAESKKSLEGFGPIKFGMTVKQAWDAIKGKGKWLQFNLGKNEELTYRLDLPTPGIGIGSLRVNQTFIDGRASVVSASLHDGYRSDIDCVFLVPVIVSHIAYLYGQDPVHLSYSSNVNALRADWNVYTFAFHKGTYIQVSYYRVDRAVEQHIEEFECQIYFQYSPTHQNTIYHFDEYCDYIILTR